MPKITTRVVNSLKSKSTQYKISDDEIRGFGVTVYSSGRKAFFVQYGSKNRRRRYTFGDYGTFTVEAARGRARELLQGIEAGNDPLVQRLQQKAIPTFSEFRSEYLLEVSRRKKEPKRDEYFLKHKTPRTWDNVPVDEISVAMVQRHFDDYSKKYSIACNRWLASLSAMLQSAWRKSLIPENVARKVQKLPENPPRTRVLSDDEMTRLLAAIEKLPRPHDRAMFQILIVSGCRISEVLRARWDDIDFNQKIWRLPKTKSGKPQQIPLPLELCSLLQTLPRKSLYIIPGRGLRPRTRPTFIWKKLCQDAALEFVGIHDLRRTAGLAWARSAGLHIASKLLRHSNVHITEQVYSPLGLDALRAAMQERTKVLPFERKAAAK